MQKVKRLLCCHLKGKREFFSACSRLRIDIVSSCNPKCSAVWKFEVPASLRGTASVCDANAGPTRLPLPGGWILPGPDAQHCWCSAHLAAPCAQSQAAAAGWRSLGSTGHSWVLPMPLSDQTWWCRICKLMFLKWVWFWTIISIALISYTALFLQLS